MQQPSGQPERHTARIGAELALTGKHRLVPKDLDRVRRPYAVRLGKLKSDTMTATGQEGKGAASKAMPTAAPVSP
jgi:hypothetical protein